MSTQENLSRPDLLCAQNPVLRHLLDNKQPYLILLSTLVLLFSFLRNQLAGKPVILESESYFHLAQAQLATWKEPGYFLLAQFTQDNFILLAILLTLLAGATIYLLCKLSDFFFRSFLNF